MTSGLQQNNYSPMGQGQPNKKGQKKNFMNSTMGMEEQQMVEPIAPGIPAAQIGTSIQSPTQGNAPSGVPQSNQPSPSYSPSIFQGFTPLQRMEGFDFNREQNTGKSAKDAFAFLSNEAVKGGHAAPLDASGPEAKKQYADWFNTYIAPGFSQLGNTIDWVDGDKFGWHNWQGKFNTDYGRGAGAPGAALAWQTDWANVPTSAPANEMYQQYQSQLSSPTQQSGNEEELLQLLEALQKGLI